MLPLNDVTVFEMAGLAPAPFAGMILADFGAKVIRVDRPNSTHVDLLSRNKQSIALDMKNPASIQLFKSLITKADILLDPFRPGVMEKLGLGPSVLLEINPTLIFARLSGYGQTGSSSMAAGHDINYLAISGVLEMLGRKGEAPAFPMNLLADFAGGGLMCVMGILIALYERSRSGKGQIVDANLTSGTAYLNSFPYLMRQQGLIWSDERGSNMLDSGAHFYEVYKTKDDRYMAVGAIEPQFYAELLHGLGLDKQSDLPGQLETEHWPSMKARFTEIFATKTQLEWTQIFDGTDACVTPVLSTEESIPGYTPNSHSSEPKQHYWPRQALPPHPAPLLSRTPARFVSDKPTLLQGGAHSVQILSDFGLTSKEIESLIHTGAIYDISNSNL
ncbi:CoA-transferase family III domain-containing protein [Halteromyces radiatus]|uniref:CoA-transferase family III domain-containing protein n=1 Tax=Halteromyces radiatus TaxID=101107 RepID=UPI002221096C|nr:CoA-transferase family III domain-containing protein [Halteromyces radiatus]KAI8096716.1 CoA-transferase family III domain-containing protein [Halteromyces radiatus]